MTVAAIAVSSLRWAGGRNCNVRDETIAPTRNRDDEAMVVGPLAEHPAQRVNRLREIAFFDDDLRPERFHEGALVEELSGVLDEIQQRVEYFSSHLQRLAIDARGQHTALRIQAELAELINTMCLHCGHAESKRTSLR
jgi:hypothetical protein